MERALGGYLIALVDEYCRVTGYKASTVGMRSLSSGTFFDGVRGGTPFTLARFDAAVTWFAANWPAGARWPRPPSWPYPSGIVPIDNFPTNQKPRRTKAA